MSLPIFSELKANPDRVTDSTCGPGNCVTCPALAARECEGCTTSYRDNICIKSVCERQCLGCGGTGGPNDRTMAVCGRTTSMRDTWYKEIGGFSFDWNTVTKHPPIILKERFIPALHGKTELISDLAPFVEAWAVSAHKVFGKNGNQIANDFKDYYKIAKGAKLFMTHTHPEDWVETMWRRADVGFQPFGVDYWTSNTCSVVLDDCKFMQHFNWKRRAMSLAHSRGHILVYHLGNVKLPKDYKGAVGRVHNVMFYLESYIRHSKDHLQVLRANVSSALDLFGENCTYFFDLVTFNEPFRASLGDRLYTRLHNRHRYHIISKNYLMHAMNRWGVFDPVLQKKIEKEDSFISRRERALANIHFMRDMWGRYD